MDRHITNEEVRLCVEWLIKKLEQDASASVKEAWRTIKPSGVSFPSVFEKISASIISSNKYIRTEKGEDYFISKNPNYEMSETVKETNLLQQKTLKIAVGVSILTIIITVINIIITNQSNRWKQINIQEQLKNLKLPTIQIDSLVFHYHSKDSLDK